MPTTTPTTVPSGAQQPIPSNFNVSTWLNGTPANPPFTNSGNFRTQCEFSHLAYDDPIVYPGQPHASHLHQFFGNTGANAFSTYSSLRTTGDGTCQGGPVNRTGYWTPTLMNDAGQVVVPALMTVYYKAEYQPPSTTSSFPPGFRYIAGYNGSNPSAPTHLNWYCATVQVKRQTIPSCPVGDQILANIEFPQCWNGIDVDSADHRSHTAYVSYINGVPTCPPGYPKHLPELTEIVIWDATSADESAWTISSDAMFGKTHGESFHADWVGAWDTPVQEIWTQECVREMRDCIDGQMGDGRTLRQVVQYTGPSSVLPTSLLLDRQRHLQHLPFLPEISLLSVLPLAWRAAAPRQRTSPSAIRSD
jgi:hypothetical protein